MLELQVRRPGSWQTFKVVNTHKGGRFGFRYRFTRTTRRQRYRFRAFVPAQSGYPYAAGRSKALGVVVDG
jgi:hypothetical protein